LKKTLGRHLFARFRHSRRALAIPVTFLILFVSTLGLISVTYYFSVEKVNGQSQTLKVATAKQDILSLDQKIMSVVWQPGSASTIEIGDSGGKLNVQPAANLLTIRLTDNREVNETVYNGTIGQVVYELPFSESPDSGLFLKGDSRTVTNQSGSIITQLYIASGVEHAEIHLRYRPAVSFITAGTEGNRAVNNLRIYVVNMNNSDSIALHGKLPLRISCESAQITRATYTLDYAIAALSVTSIIDGDRGQVAIPVSSTSDGAVINIEIVQCNLTVKRSVL
jgi:hypothetical protein